MKRADSKSKGVADKRGLLFVHQDAVKWCLNELKFARRDDATAVATAVASSQGGSREKSSDARSKLFKSLGDIWVVKVLFTLGDIPVSCVTAANDLVAAKVREKEGREVERLLH